MKGCIDDYSFHGQTGEWGELTSATIGYRGRPLVSLSSDMTRALDYDGVSAVNITGELVQLMGIYYHGDLYPMSRKSIMDMIARVVHACVSPARSARKNISTMRYTPARDGRPAYIREKGENLFVLTEDTVTIGINMRVQMLGSDHRLLHRQARDLQRVLAQAPDFSVRYSYANRLVGRTDTAPLLPLD